jgi:hypothetical protein
MAITVRHILKSEDVKIEGRFQLMAEQMEQNLSQQGNTVSTSPEVRIVEKHSEYAVIEITCACGRKTCLRCEYT